MAVLSDIIRQVRMQVRDVDAPPRYDNQYYTDAVSFALKKLNFDLRESTFFDVLPPWSISSLPATLDFLLMKLATIQMSAIRASEDTAIIDDEYGSYDEFARISQISVPNLSVTAATRNIEVQGPAFWLKLLDRLQREYDGEIRRFLERTLATISVGVMTRVSTRTGGIARYEFDRGLPATTLAVAYVAGVLTATWAILYADTFFSYEVIHVRPGGSEETLATYYDNHEHEHTETLALSAGRHRFYINTVNRNDIKTASNIVDILI